MKKKVLFVGSFLNKSKDGGVGGQMFACTSLVNSELNSEFSWILIDSTADSNMNVSLLRRLFKAMKRLLKFIKSIVFSKIDVVIIFTADGLSFLEKGLMVKFVSILSASTNVILAPRSGYLINQIQQHGSGFARFVFRSSDYVLCQGNSWKEFFKESVGEAITNYIVIKNWIDISSYNYTIPKNEKINILFLGWIVKEKGVYDLLNAVNMLVESGITSFVLKLAGKGEDEESARSFVKEKGLEPFVSFEGWVLGESKYVLLENSDVFILPSYFEGSPNALIEAMATGNACISTNVGAVPDIIQDGVNGFIVDSGNIDRLALRIENLIEDEQLRLSMAESARESIIENHSIKVAVEQFQDLMSK